MLKDKWLWDLVDIYFSYVSYVLISILSLQWKIVLYYNRPNSGAMQTPPPTHGLFSMPYYIEN